MRQGAEGLQRQDPVAGDPQGLSGDALEALGVLSFPVLEIASDVSIKAINKLV